MVSGTKERPSSADRIVYGTDGKNGLTKEAVDKCKKMRGERPVVLSSRLKIVKADYRKLRSVWINLNAGGSPPTLLLRLVKHFHFSSLAGD